MRKANKALESMEVMTSRLWKPVSGIHKKGGGAYDSLRDNFNYY